MVKSSDEVDVCDVKQIDAALDSLSKPIDVLINLAAILLYKPMLETTDKDWDRVLDTNLKGTFLMSQRVAHNMIKHNVQGSIINVSSICGSRAQLDVVAYGSSKSGLIILTKNSALELTPHGIRVNCLAPGIMLTPMMEDIWDTPRGQALLDIVPMKRAAEVEELMGILLLLSGNHSSYMTGAIIEVDCGLCCAEMRT